MKTRVQNLLAAALLLPALNIPFASVRAQGTAFTYQGRLNSGGGPAGGSYDLTFTLYDSTNLPGNVIAGPLTNSATGVTNGLFTISLDFGAGVFTGNARWLEIAVRTNGGGGFVTLAPRQLITPTPYAIMAGSASNLLGALPAAQLSGMIPSSDISGTYTGPVKFNNGADSFDGTFVGQFFGSSFFGGSFNGNFYGDGSGLFNLNASQLTSGTVPDARLAGNMVRTNQVWLLDGNLGTNPNMNFIGTTDNQPLIVKVNGLEAERFEPTANSPNIVGGFAGNFDSGTLDYGVTISGGGGIGYTNSIQGMNVAFATIAGGAANTINGMNAYHAVIGGGSFNTIAGDAVYQSTIAGGSGNMIQGADSVIGGGNANTIASNNYTPAIVAGSANQIQDNSWGAFIGAGYQNIIQPGSGYSAIPGGYQNLIMTNNSYTVIAGGYYNAVQVAAPYSFIGGGNNNTIQPDAGGSVIGGGNNSTIWTNADHSVIGGGWQNQIQPFGWESVIAGGELNIIGPNSQWSAIGGGEYNTIQTNSQFSNIGGGQGNNIHSAVYASSIASGFYNAMGATNFGNFIGGGQGNLIDSFNTIAVIGGGLDNRIAGNYLYYSNFYAIGSTIAGGTINVIDLNNLYDTIGGGWDDIIQSNAEASTIGGGIYGIIQTNAYSATIGGGYFNQAGGKYSVVPGGVENIANGNGSFAAGAFAQATNNGSFVLADYEFTNFNSTASNQLSARFTGGIVFVTAGAGMTLDGLPIFAGNNGASLANVNALTLNGLSSSTFAPASGSSSYIQNQTGPAQTASFDITGNGTVNGAVTTTTLIVSNVIASGPVTAPTVAANGVTGGTLSATTVANASALVITNSFRVSGAGKATPTPAFIVVSASTNLPYSNAVRINNPLCDGKPNAILLVTHNVSAQSSFGYNNHPLGVWYDGANWEILNEDVATMPTNIAFNVLIINP